MASDRIILYCILYVHMFVICILFMLRTTIIIA